MNAKEYQKQYYLKVTKPKRHANKTDVECVCTMCGKIFMSKTKKTQYCEECRKIAKRENMRRFREALKTQTEKYEKIMKRAEENRKKKYHEDEEIRRRRLDQAKKSREKKLASMTAEELEAYREKMREKARMYYKKKQNKDL